jgi:hypothetical protein
MLGAGHGWGKPFYFTPALFILYPIVLIRLIAPRELPSLVLDVSLLAAALVLDLLLVRATQSEGVEYFWRLMAAPPFPHLWLLIWFLWQMLAVKLVVSGFLARGR